MRKPMWLRNGIQLIGNSPLKYFLYWIFFTFIHHQFGCSKKFDPQSHAKSTQYLNKKKKRKKGGQGSLIALPPLPCYLLVKRLVCILFGFSKHIPNTLRPPIYTCEWGSYQLHEGDPAGWVNVGGRLAAPLKTIGGWQFPQPITAVFTWRPTVSRGNHRK